jgi:O-antigen/teichoic acid export membrane protein
MRFKFFSHLVLMIGLNLLIKPIAIFGIDAQVQNIVGPAEYGLYFSLLNFTYLFNIILDLGITNFNIKNLAQHPHLAKQYLGKIIPIRVLLFFIYVVLVYLIAKGLNYSEKQFSILWVLVFNQFLISSIFYIRSYFAGLLLLKAEVIFSVLDKLFLILIVGFYLFGFGKEKINIHLFVELQTFSYLFTFILALLLLIYKIGKPKIKWHFSFNQLMISKSFPYALLIVLMMFYNRIDSVMIERISGSKEAGIYAQAYRLLDAFFMFATLFSSLLFPIFTNMIKSQISILSLLNSSQRILISGAILIAGISFFNAPYLLNLIYNQDITQSSEIFKLLMISFIPVCFIVIFGTLLTANGNLKFLNRLSLFGIFLNFILNYLMIPKLGAYGAALTSLITQSLIAFFQIFYVFKSFKFDFKLNQSVKYIGFVTLILILGLLIPFENSIYSILTFFFFSFLYLIYTHLFEWKLILQFVQGKNN